MKQKDLIEQIVADAGLPKASVETLLGSLGRVASKALGDGDDVTIPGLVRLSTRQRAARVGRNPKTGEAVDVPAKTVVAAKPVAALAAYVA